MVGELGHTTGLKFSLLPPVPRDYGTQPSTSVGGVVLKSTKPRKTTTLLLDDFDVVIEVTHYAGTFSRFLLAGSLAGFFSGSRLGEAGSGGRGGIPPGNHPYPPHWLTLVAHRGTSFLRQYR